MAQRHITNAQVMSIAKVFQIGQVGPTYQHLTHQTSMHLKPGSKLNSDSPSTVNLVHVHEIQQITHSTALFHNFMNVII